MKPVEGAAGVQADVDVLMGGSMGLVRTGGL